jgi:hypothetical protein
MTEQIRQQTLAENKTIDILVEWYTYAFELSKGNAIEGYFTAWLKLRHPEVYNQVTQFSKQIAHKLYFIALERFKKLTTHGHHIHNDTQGHMAVFTPEHIEGNITEIKVSGNDILKYTSEALRTHNSEASNQANERANTVLLKPIRYTGLFGEFLREVQMYAIKSGIIKNYELGKV